MGTGLNVGMPYHPEALMRPHHFHNCILHKEEGVARLQHCHNNATQ